MWRFFLIATAIVLAVAVAGGAWWAAQLRKPIALQSVPGSPAPPNGAVGSDAAGSDGAFVTQTAWALSALPECLEQVQLTRGPLGYVRRYLPSGVTAIPTGDALRYGDCTITYDGRTVIARRGVDRLSVTPPAMLYRRGRRLYVFRRQGADAELRVYDPSNLR